MGWIITTAIGLLILIIASVAHLASANEVKTNPRNDDAAIMKTVSRVVQGLAVLFIIVVVFFSSVHSISAGYTGVTYSFGEITGHVGDGSGGVVLTWPWEDVKQANIQIQIDKPESACSDGTPNCLNAFSSESQDVYIAPILNIQVEAANIQTLYTQIGPNYVQKIVIPQMIQITKEETVKYAAKDVAPNRAKIASDIQQRLIAVLQPYSITVKGFTIQNISFTKAFQDAIDQATTAEQNAKTEQANVAVHSAKADQLVADAKGQADAQVTLAKGQADANTLINASLTPNLIAYTEIQKLSPDVKVIMMPVGGNGMIFDMSGLVGSSADQPTK